MTSQQARETLLDSGSVLGLVGPVLASSHTSDFTTGPRVATLPDTFTIGSVLGLVGLVSTSLSHTSEFTTGAGVPTLPDALQYRVIGGSGWPGVSML